ncbi:RES domain-containing protein [uncultured Acinetobacter sp.]|uniref:RES domain-containing protein n=1 Tax=uncultured Acinetobacter sp. TaxID=165433 RepID=UPI0025838F67|nr:RES domain-containing protein [uncultured Acinetobacter sp.]
MHSERILKTDEQKKLFSLELDIFFSVISVKKLKDKIAAFQVKKDDQSPENFWKSICISLPLEFSFISDSLKNFSFKKGGHLFRVRKLTDQLREQISKGRIEESELWEPPIKYAYRGRVNRENEPYLYVSESNLDICVSEARLKENDEFLLISYEVLSPLEVTGIGFKSDLDNLEISSSTKKKINILNTAIRKIFLKDSVNAYVYSNYIANDLYNFRNGWAYPSVQSNKGKNICLKLSEKKKLKVHTLITGIYRPNDRCRYIFKEAFDITDDRQICYSYLENEEKDSFLRVWHKTFIDPKDKKPNDESSVDDKSQLIVMDKIFSKQT